MTSPDKKIIKKMKAMDKEIGHLFKWCQQLEEMRGRLDHEVEIVRAGLRCAALDPPADLDERAATVN